MKRAVKQGGHARDARTATHEGAQHGQLHAAALECEAARLAPCGIPAPLADARSDACKHTVQPGVHFHLSRSDLLIALQCKLYVSQGAGGTPSSDAGASGAETHAPKLRRGRGRTALSFVKTVLLPGLVAATAVLAWYLHKQHHSWGIHWPLAHHEVLRQTITNTDVQPVSV